MNFTRRNFIKACAVSTAMLTAGCSVNKSGTQTESQKLNKSDADSWVKSVCRYCGTGCGVLIGVTNGKVIAVKGDPDNEVNKGLLCAKGYYLPQILTADDRITQPLVKKNGKFVETSWEEAMNLITEKFSNAIDEYGPASVGFYGSGQALAEEEYVANKLFKGAIGSNNV